VEEETSREKKKEEKSVSTVFRSDEWDNFQLDINNFFVSDIKADQEFINYKKIQGEFYRQIHHFL